MEMRASMMRIEINNFGGRELRSDYVRPVFRVDFSTLRASFIWNRLAHNNPYYGRGSRLQARHRNAQAVGSSRAAASYPASDRDHEGVEYDYSRAGGTTREQGAALRQSLPRFMDTSTIPLLDHLGVWRANPRAFIWKPNDHHPGHRGPWRCDR
jgi:hypothetical protein